MQSYTNYRQPTQVLFTDIDDTLTNHGRLGPQAYSMLWKLAEAGIQIVPITGRPAGWCEMIARFWPVHSIIGENGAFYFSYQNKKMQRHFVIDEKIRKENTKRLEQIKKEVLATVPGAAVSSDQFTRLFDLAIDFCEDVPPLPQSDIDEIVKIFRRHGAQAKVSSIHVNGWFGNYDKKTMCETFYQNVFAKKLKDELDNCIFIGDSPNDEPMFEFFKHSFAVKNIEAFLPSLEHQPKYLIPEDGGDGFAKLGDHLLGLVF